MDEWIILYAIVDHAQNHAGWLFMFLFRETFRKTQNLGSPSLMTRRPVLLRFSIVVFWFIYLHCLMPYNWASKEERSSTATWAAGADLISWTTSWLCSVFYICLKQSNDSTFWFLLLVPSFQSCNRGSSLLYASRFAFAINSTIQSWIGSLTKFLLCWAFDNVWLSVYLH